MRKLAWLGLLVVATTGCGRGWLPILNRGAPCGSSCGLVGNSLPAALPADTGCSTCGTSASYGSYEGEVIGSNIVEGGYYGSGVVEYPGTVINNGGYIDGAIVNPSMAPIASPAS